MNGWDASTWYTGMAHLVARLHTLCRILGPAKCTMWIKKAQLLCFHQELSRCRTRGESEESIASR